MEGYVLTETCDGGELTIVKIYTLPLFDCSRIVLVLV